MPSEYNIRDKVRGSIFGGAIGDALGYQIEFETGIKPKQVTRFKENPGIFSDDTQMTLFTACSLLWREERFRMRGIAALPHEAVYLGYLDWLDTQQRAEEHDHVAWIREIPELNIMRDPGMTCISALSSGKRGTLENPINDSKGCGGIMRIAPVGLYLNPLVTDMSVGEFSARICAITHGHPLAILSAFVFGETIFHLTNMNSSVEESVNFALDKMDAWRPYMPSKSGDFRRTNLYKKEKPELRAIIEQSIALAKDKPITDQQAIMRLGDGWVAEEALAIAIYSALKHESSFEDTVICAVNHDGDSDSTGSIAGNIIGARLGYDKIPDYFRENIELKEVLLKLSDDMA